MIETRSTAKVLLFPALVLALFLIPSFSPAEAAPSTTRAIEWHPWSDAIFAQAAREHKFVLLDLEAVWCHWCHVMDQNTYSDPAVQRLMGEKYLAVKVDQDSRPDISNRYEDYGWPATVIFKADGSELVKRQGYLPPKLMASMLQAVIDDPSPGPSVVAEKEIHNAATPFLDPALLAAVKAEFQKQYDVEGKGWAFGHKYLDGESVQYANTLAREGDIVEATRVADTLHVAQKLLDPVWGGAYQYSTGGNWDEPHFEKLLFIQAEVMRAYAQSYDQWGVPADLEAAKNVHRYVLAFLTSPEGAFYVSQDADVIKGKPSADYFALPDAKRRALGIPRVDKHLYARENGWIIRALCDLYVSTGDRTVLSEAERSARWVVAHRTIPGGGFAHGEQDAGGPYLGDSLAMGQAFLSLYEVTGEREWLTRAEASRRFIARAFVAPPTPGFVTSATSTNHVYRPHPERDENAQVAQYANLLYQYTGEKEDREMATRAMRFLASRETALAWLSAPILLAEAQFTNPPVHVTVVGTKADPSARSLFQAALLAGPTYKRVEWWDKSEGALPRADVQYPTLNHAAAFLCTASACSSPISDVHILESRLHKIRE